MKKLLIIKLGGSVITYKTISTPKPRISVIKRLSKEIFELYKKDYQIIIVHGGGSYGHNLAQKYDTQLGLINKNSTLGLAETVNSMMSLNNIIIQIMIGAKLPVLSLSPHSFMTQSNKKLDNFNVDIIKTMLDSNFIPVLYGDGVIDTKLGCSILSGDQIVAYLARKFKAKKVIFLSDVDGIFTDDPKINPKAKFIPKIDNENFMKVLSYIKSNNSDVTGQMRGKLLEIKKGLPNITTVISNGFKKEGLLTLIEQGNQGTVLFFKNP